MSSKTRLILNGVLPILGVALVILGVGQGGKLPGLAGEIFRKLIGFMFTPVFLELTFALLGLFAVFWVNKIRLKRDGDDYVEMKIEDEPQDKNS